MSLRRRLLLPLLPLVVLAACSTAVAPGDDPPAPGGTQTDSAPKLLTALPRELTAAERAAVQSSGDFSLALFREVNKRKAATNVFVSPLSAAVALAMTAQGAAGQTELEMRRTLGFGDQTLAGMGEAYRTLYTLLVGLDAGVTVKSANAIWYRNGVPVLPSFVDAAQRLFGAQVTGANFADETATLNAINGWAKAQTNGKIEKVLEHISKDEVLFLLNALYFKGSWRDKFDAKLTAPAPFTSADGRVSQVPTMNREGTMRWGRGADFTAVDLPYGNGAFSMTVLLPDAGRTADALATSLDAKGWSALVASLHDGRVQLALPKFTMKYEDEWTDVLSTLGMPTAFSDFADFSRMVQGGGVKIYFVKQNSFVDVNEEGTEAAAVTTIGIGVTSAPQTQVVRVDRPFVFVIRERLSGSVLFIGKVDKL